MFDYTENVSSNGLEISYVKGGEKEWEIMGEWGVVNKLIVNDNRDVSARTFLINFDLTSDNLHSILIFAQTQRQSIDVDMYEEIIKFILSNKVSPLIDGEIIRGTKKVLELLKPCSAKHERTVRSSSRGWFAVKNGRGVKDTIFSVKLNHSGLFGSLSIVGGNLNLRNKPFVFMVKDDGEFFNEYPVYKGEHKFYTEREVDYNFTIFSGYKEDNLPLEAEILSQIIEHVMDGVTGGDINTWDAGEYYDIDGLVFKEFHNPNSSKHTFKMVPVVIGDNESHIFSSFGEELFFKDVAHSTSSSFYRYKIAETNAGVPTGRFIYVNLDVETPTGHFESEVLKKIENKFDILATHMEDTIGELLDDTIGELLDETIDENSFFSYAIDRGGLEDENHGQIVEGVVNFNDNAQFLVKIISEQAGDDVIKVELVIDDEKILVTHRVIELLSDYNLTKLPYSMLDLCTGVIGALSGQNEREFIDDIGLEAYSYFESRVDNVLFGYGLKLGEDRNDGWKVEDTENLKRFMEYDIDFTGEFVANEDLEEFKDLFKAEEEPLYLDMDASLIRVGKVNWTEEHTEYFKKMLGITDANNKESDDEVKDKIIPLNAFFELEIEGIGYVTFELVQGEHVMIVDNKEYEEGRQYIQISSGLNEFAFPIKEGREFTNFEDFRAYVEDVFLNGYFEKEMLKEILG